jgi:hypothetical protein
MLDRQRERKKDNNKGRETTVTMVKERMNESRVRHSPLTNVIDNINTKHLIPMMCFSFCSCQYIYHPEKIDSSRSVQISLFVPLMSTCATKELINL